MYPVISGNIKLKLTYTVKQHSFVPNRFIYFRLEILLQEVATIWNKRKSCFTLKVGHMSTLFSLGGGHYLAKGLKENDLFLRVHKGKPPQKV